MSSLSPATLKVISDYLNLPFANGAVNCPYYNNRHLVVRGGLRAAVGKGSVADIMEEAMIVSLRDKVDLTKLTPQQGKEFLVDHRLGIDCSGLVYYVLEAELKARGKNRLNKQLVFPHAKNFLRKLLTKLRPVENAGVDTLADNRNSHIVALNQVKPGDFITMQNAESNKYISHVVIIHQVDYHNNLPVILHYTHSIPWRTDGKYGHGVRQGTIMVQNQSNNLLDQLWSEKNVTNEANETYFDRARNAQKLALRRLRALA